MSWDTDAHDTEAETHRFSDEPAVVLTVCGNPNAGVLLRDKSLDYIIYLVELALKDPYEFAKAVK